MVQVAEEKPGLVPPPRARAGAKECPRCSAHLLVEGDHFACLMCGYEHRALPAQRPGPRHAGDILDALPELRAEVANYLDGLGRAPAAGSQGRRELGRANEAETCGLELARTYACQSLVASGHGLIALARALEPPAPEYGTWSTLLGILRAAGMAGWLLDPALNRQQRVRRALTLHTQDLADEHRVMTETVERTPGAADFFTDALHENNRRRRELGEHRRTVGEQDTLPSDDELATLMGATAEYHLAASVAEGRPWALRHLTDTALAREADWAGAALLAQVHAAAGWYARAVWAYARWMRGAAVGELCELLEFGYDSLVMPQTPDVRFWREGDV